ncbi:hypothetical protein [Nocardia sp. SC052]|uniref:hypothetical protein n=1 Tax=Nocardia sichangensis TaxID=3385975 RepID=UPI00399F2AFA
MATGRSGSTSPKGSCGCRLRAHEPQRPHDLDKCAKTPTVIDADDGEDVVLVVNLICDHTLA